MEKSTAPTTNTVRPVVDAGVIARTNCKRRTFPNEMNGKILLIHHGGHRGGSGVCWDLRSEKRAYLAGDYRDLADYGVISPQQFVALSPDVEKGYEWKGEYINSAIRFPTKEAALLAAEKLNLEVITPQALSKQIKQSQI